jgi:hypothetical protein
MALINSRGISTGILSASLLALAVSQANAGEPAKLKAGGVDITPFLDISESRSDNIYSSPDNEESSNILVINPGILAEIVHGDSLYSLNAELFDGTYSDGLDKDDDYTDWVVAFDADIALNQSNKIMLGASTSENHEDRGDGVTQGTTGFATPVEYDEGIFSAGYRLGNDDSRFSVELGAGRQDLEYTIFKQLTAIRSYEKDDYGIKVYAELAPNTDLVVEYNSATFEYDTALSAAQNLDSDEDKILFGVVWEATGNTTGTAKVGRVDKAFDSASRDDFTGTIWLGQADWTPSEQTLVTLYSSQEPRETAVGNGNFVDGTMTGASWTQGWTSSISTTVNYGMGDDDYDETNRSDDVTNYGVSVDYEFRRFLSIGVAYDFDERDSNINAFDYERNIYSLNVSLSL